MNDVKEKATRWMKNLGDKVVLPVAVLSGVFDLRHLEDAQNHGVTLFWGHNLQSLAAWIKSAKMDAPIGTKTNRK